MDGWILGTLGFLAGYLTVLLTEYVRYLLDKRKTSAQRRYERQSQAVDEAYGPAIYVLDAAIDKFPQHSEEFQRLRTLFEQKSSFFDPADRDHLWLVMTEGVDKSTLIEVRQLLEEARQKKERALR